MPNNIITEFPISIYGNLQKYNDTISKGRCRIFYKYGNRNGGYITDDFAEKLLSTLPYTPVKGIFDSAEGDYIDHGASRNEGRIYGIVPENPNVAWEEHLDEDGVVRTYACTDVLIFTALYNEANSVLEKGQSMELYVPSIKGSWQFIEGRRYYVYEEGCFLGLQILGEGVEPCFEGASFYSLYNDLKNILDKIEGYNKKISNGGKSRMINYKLSDNQKFNAIWNLLNLNYNEQGGWCIDYEICEIYDEYALVRNYGEAIFERIYYTKNDENDTIILGEHERCFIMDVTETEKNALEALEKLHNNTFEGIETSFANLSNDLKLANDSLSEKDISISSLNEQISTLQEEISAFDTKKTDYENQISTLTMERDEANTNFSLETQTTQDLRKQVEALTQFKAEVEKNEKKAIIAKYEDLLEATTIANFIANIDNYNSKDLKKELAYQLVETNSTIFTKDQEGAGFIPKGEPTGGLEDLLNKYRK